MSEATWSIEGLQLNIFILYIDYFLTNCLVYIVSENKDKYSVPVPRAQCVVFQLQLKNTKAASAHTEGAGTYKCLPFLFSLKLLISY